MSDTPPQAGEPEEARPEAPAAAEAPAVASEAERSEGEPGDPLAEARRERDEYLELAQRTRADLENYRKRAARDSAEAERRGRGTLVSDLVPVLDNLERALRSAGLRADGSPAEPAPEAVGGSAERDAALGQGLALVYRELSGALERAGVESYDPAGERFDPSWHEALSTRPGPEPGIVLETVEKGYRLDGQVLRAARVVVSQ